MSSSYLPGEPPVSRILFPLITGLLFAGSYIAGKYTTLDLGPLTTTLVRYSFALLFLAALLPYYKPHALLIERRDLPALLLLGLFGIVGYHYFFFLSLRYTAVANTAIINALSPVITVVAAGALLGERLAVKNYVGVALAFAGVLILLSGGRPATLAAIEFNEGDLLMLLAVLSWTAYALLIKKLLARYSGYTLTFYAALFGVLLLLLIAPGEGATGQLAQISRTSVVSVVYMGVCASGLGYLLYNLSIREIGPTRTSSFVYSIVPLVVALLALVFFREAITVTMILSAALILAGLHLMLAAESKRAAV